MSEIDKRVNNGGARVGAGRKKKAETKVIRVPVEFISQIEMLLAGELLTSSNASLKKELELKQYYLEGEVKNSQNLKLQVSSLYQQSENYRIQLNRLKKGLMTISDIKI